MPCSAATPPRISGLSSSSAATAITKRSKPAGVARDERAWHRESSGLQWWMVMAGCAEINSVSDFPPRNSDSELCSSMRLSPFSFVILVLVGRGGAGPHDLRRMAEDEPRVLGRRAEPVVRGAESGSRRTATSRRTSTARARTRQRHPLHAHRARPRARLRSRVRTPATLPRIQNEPVHPPGRRRPRRSRRGARGARGDAPRPRGSRSAGVEAGQERAAEIPHRAQPPGVSIRPLRAEAAALHSGMAGEARSGCSSGGSSRSSRSRS